MDNPLSTTQFQRNFCHHLLYPLPLFLGHAELLDFDGLRACRKPMFPLFLFSFFLNGIVDFLEGNFLGREKYHRYESIADACDIAALVILPPPSVKILMGRVRIKS